MESVYRWIDGVNMPSIDNLYALSALFQLPMDAIVRGNRAPIVPSIPLETHDLRDRRLYAYYEKLNTLCVA